MLSGNHLGDKQFSYYQMTISERYFTGKENLAIKVIQDSFDSDPDIFISRVSVTGSPQFHLLLPSDLIRFE